MKSYFKSSFFIVLLLLLTVAQPSLLSESSENKEIVLHVDDDNIKGPWDGSAIYPFQTIPDAINASSSKAMIYVHHGIYDEHIIIQKPLTLIGETKEKTIIKQTSPDSMILIQHTHQVTITNFTIQNNNTMNQNETGILIKNTTTSVISQSIIEGFTQGISITDQSKNNIIYDTIIRGNDIGLTLSESNKNLVYANTFSDNTIQFILTNTKQNRINENCFIHEQQKPTFINSQDIIDHNYWGKTTLFYVIFGLQTINLIDITLTWLKCDWHPAQSKDELQTNPLIRMNTTRGTMIFELYQEKMPLTCENFINLSKIEFFEGLVFHRVIDDFVIQGGGYDVNGTRKESPFGPIDLETHPEVNHVDGAISMARTQDPNSATSQFFVCDGKQETLDGKYAAFGVILIGFDVLRDIASVETTTKHGFMKNWPIDDIIITSTSVISK